MNIPKLQDEVVGLGEDREAAREALSQMEPETPLGARLIELALRGIEEGVLPLNEDEMATYLGRNRYADLR